MSNRLSDNPLEPKAEKQQLSITPMEETVAEYQARTRKKSVAEKMLISFGVFIWESCIEMVKFLGAVVLAISLIVGAVCIFLVAPFMGFDLIIQTDHDVIGGILIFVGFVAWGAVFKSEQF